MPYSDYPILGAEVTRARKQFLAPSVDNQTRKYDPAFKPPSLSIKTPKF